MAGEGKPADDAVKLFVGQVPRDWGVDELRPILMEAGHVYEISIVRDRETRESRGCAFVLYMTRAEADNAIKLFHGNRTLPGAKAAMQVKFAEGQEAKIENKLFVGMLPKSVSADDLRQVFSPFGTVLELNVLRGPAHASRGSAFVKFEQYNQAVAAIEGLNNKHKLDGQANAIVVKWADSEKEKNLRRVQKSQQQQSAAGGLGGISGSGMGMLTPQMGAASGGYLFGAPSGGSIYSLPYSGMDSPGNVATAAAQAAAAAAAAAAGVYSGGAGGVTGAEMYSQLPYHFSAIPGYLGPGKLEAGVPDVVNVQGVPNASASAVAAAIREKLVQREGPPGANLFVYNIPSEWGDGDLMTAFSEFGNLVSTKVFIDKLTRQSKNFGFVSFHNPEAAAAAIAVMDGFMVGGRKLKVSLKRGAPGVAAAAGGFEGMSGNGGTSAPLLHFGGSSGYTP